MPDQMRKQPNSHFCFVCGLQNVAGMQVAFYETTDAEGTPEVLARFHGRPQHQGYPGRMHGGVITGILDEVIARAVNIGDGGLEPAVWGITAEIQVRFERPVPLEEELTVRGRITRDRRKLFEGSAELYLPDGSVAARATGKYFKQPLDEISGVNAETLGWRVYED